MSAKTIDEVITRLDGIIKTALDGNSRIGYFASLYKRMTVAVKHGIDAGAFEDGERMRKLDIIFANRYLDAYDAYITANNLSHSWHKAFDATKNNSLTVLQHLILGINTHINLDLAIAAAQTMNGQQIALLQYDFNKINAVIGDLVNEVQDELSIISFPMRFIDSVCNKNDEAVINFSITIARREAWRLAISLAESPDQEQKVLINRTDNFIALIASRIINPGLLTRFLLMLVKWLEWNDIPKIINQLNRKV